jgi:outer membrane assembly lipoprotein YfiO
MSSAEILARAQEAYAQESWGDAIEALERLLTVEPSFEDAPTARILLADAYFADEKFITAQQEYTRFLDRFPGHDFTPEAALGICRSFVALSPIPERDQRYTRQALLVCPNVARDYTGIDDDVAAEAARLTNEMRAKLAEKLYLTAHDFYASRQWWDSAIIYYEMIVEDYADTEWAPRAIVGLIQAYTSIGYEDDVETWRQRLLNSYPDSPEARAMDNGGGGSANG